MTVDLSTVPLVALSIESKYAISSLLNPPKILPSENGLPRDWRGLAHFCKLEIERWDILDDTSKLFERDGEKYLEQLQKSQTSAEIISNGIDEKILTVGKLRQGLENQYYDAFLLYADEDVSWATEMLNKLENKYNLKLCVKDRDLIAGVTFEHEAIMTLISERCNRLIVIISSNFLKSPANKFFLNYAQALGIDKQQRKIIPCLYEICKLPPQLRYMFVLDYNRIGLYDFWEKLKDSVQVANKVKENANALLEKDMNNEIETDEESIKHVESLEVQTLELQNSKETLNIKISNPPEFNNMYKDNKKYNQFLQWTKKKLSIKGENNKKEDVAITETISLPSIEDLDLLSTSTESIEKKSKIKFIDKYVKKAHLKKIPVKS
ncbi:Myeloid differentiation primary response protein MyD88 [Melipona quadrifasciata]|uniref:Myeloid differentiation primary response protein MyD88 n=1 Tax=Melipona quadrifasciata TaxID=166423 RepID=A0A0M8ZPW1_9HYME|nr:Myeloid differentiation primary response protein MyD88 [Melipona quadrifasciata]